MQEHVAERDSSRKAELDEQILQLIHEKGTLESKAKALVAAANRNGGTDNISVILIDAFA